jgi:hypothetical protein
LSALIVFVQLAGLFGNSDKRNRKPCGGTERAGKIALELKWPNAIVRNWYVFWITVGFPKNPILQLDAAKPCAQNFAFSEKSSEVGRPVNRGGLDFL